MTADLAVTEWIAKLKLGDEASARQLWEHYFRRLVALARVKLSNGRSPLADEEDVALSAFKSLCWGAAHGRFPQLHDRDNLWPLLVVLTVRKSHDLLKHERRLKRGGRPNSAEDLPTRIGIDDLLDREPTPEFAAMLAENYQRLLSQLDAQQRQIAELKLAGDTNREVADKLGCGLRTVDRRLQLIRRIWDDAESARNSPELSS